MESSEENTCASSSFSSLFTGSTVRPSRPANSRFGSSIREHYERGQPKQRTSRRIYPWHSAQVKRCQEQCE